MEKFKVIHSEFFCFMVNFDVSIDAFFEFLFDCTSSFNDRCLLPEVQRRRKQEDTKSLENSVYR